MQFPQYTEKLDRYAREDDRLRLDGTFGDGRLSEVMKGMDIVVVPSLWFENSLGVIRGAFAHKTPVVASDLAEMVELVEHDVNGLLFCVGDTDDIGRRLSGVVEKPSLLKRLRDRIPAVKTIEDEMTDLLEIYVEVSAEHSPPLQGA